jgi:hypothetical protein
MLCWRGLSQFDFGEILKERRVIRPGPGPDATNRKPCSFGVRAGRTELSICKFGAAILLMQEESRGGTGRRSCASLRRRGPRPKPRCHPDDSHASWRDPAAKRIACDATALRAQGIRPRSGQKESQALPPQWPKVQDCRQHVQNALNERVRVIAVQSFSSGSVANTLAQREAPVSCFPIE